MGCKPVRAAFGLRLQYGSGHEGCPGCPAAADGAATVEAAGVNESTLLRSRRSRPRREAARSFRPASEFDDRDRSVTGSRGKGWERAWWPVGAARRSARRALDRANPFSRAGGRDGDGASALRPLGPPVIRQVLAEPGALPPDRGGRVRPSASGGRAPVVGAQGGNAMAEVAVRVERLEKRFGSLTAVAGLDFVVERGEVFGLLGPNGSGKTTTLNMISGLVEPTSGSVALFGMDPRRRPPAVRRLLGFVPQETALYEELTAERNLMFHAELFGIPPRQRRGRVAAMLALAQLTDRARSRVGTFSGGMKRRLAIVRALLHDPALVYLDEPTLGVDPQARRVIWDYVLQMRAEGRTVLLTTNYLEEADVLCDRLAVIDHGRLVALGVPAELRALYGKQVVGFELDAVPPLGLVDEVRRLPGVAELRTDGPKLEVTLAAAADGATLPRLVGVVVAANLGVRRLEVREPSLNDAFLALIGRGLRD